MIEHYYKLKVNSILQSKYLIERDISNLEDFINFKLKLKEPKEATVDDPLVQEILSVYKKSL